MFQIIAYKDYKKENPVIIHEPQAAFGNKLLKANLDEELNAIAEIDATIPITNEYYSKVEPLVTCVEVYNLLTDTKVFDGRVQSEEGQMDSSGQFGRSVIVESKLAYLHDSTQEFRETKKTKVFDYMKILIDTHNKQVEPHKRFELRTVEVDKSTDEVYRSIGYKSTFDTIKDKLIDRLGGYLVYEEIDGVMYLDYLKEYGQQKDTPIQLARNLLSASKKTDLTELATVIVPLGEEIQKDSDEGMEKKESDFAKERVTIKSDTQKSIELVDDKLVAAFGRMRKEIIFPNTSNKTALLNQGKNYLKNQRVALTDWTTEVVETGLIDPEYEIFEVGNYHPIVNDILAPSEKLQIVQKTTDLINPTKAKLSVGNKNKTLTQYQNEMNSQIKDFEHTKEEVKSTSSNVKTLKREGKEQAQKLVEAQEEIQAQNGVIDQININVNGNNENLQQYQELNDSVVANLQTELEETNKTIEKLEKEIEELKGGNASGLRY